MKKSARFGALEVLGQWEESQKPIGLLMELFLKKNTLPDTRDRGLLNSLVFGVVRWRGYLDWLINEFADRSTRKIKTRTRQALRIGLYQLAFMDRIPAPVAINETVAALKKGRQPAWLLSFVNGLLRNAARAALPRPDQPGDRMPETARLSHPDWLLKRWRQRYGREVEQICRANNQQPDLCLRVNNNRITTADFLGLLEQEKVACVPGRFGPEAVHLPAFHGPVTAIPGFQAGLFQIQDEAAQLICHLLGPLQAGRAYLDGCAGLGGKTTHLAQMLPEGGELTAVEPNRLRATRLKENLQRLGLTPRVEIIRSDLEHLDLSKKFTGILIDAPCSGLGVIRRQPDIRWNRRPEDLVHYQAGQLSLLDAAARLLNPDGRLVYASCSMEPEENDQVVEKFLTAHPGFDLQNCREFLPEPAKGLVDGQGFFRTVPGRHDLDGFFGACFKSRKDKT